MAEAVFDFADIRSRMLGDLKPQPSREVPAMLCMACEGRGWVEYYSTTPPVFGTCTRCFNPDGRPCP